MSPKSKLPNIALREAALTHARHRSSGVVQKVTAAMAEMDLEIAKNDGIYPLNGGKISQREVCRRANVAYITLHSPLHKQTTRVIVDNWLRGQKNKTKAETHKAVIDRVDHWKEEHRKAASQICIYELELNEHKIRIHNLEAENQSLRKQLINLRSVKPITTVK